FFSVVSYAQPFISNHSYSSIKLILVYWRLIVHFLNVFFVHFITVINIAKQVKSQQDRYVYAIGKVGDSVKLLLDPDKLLHDDMVILEQVSGESEADDTEE
ncbi:MAG: hypothetical protein IIX48_03300, partial [Lachnospiraceae bacterium]|nr:hypothetical protein [Lachnospiraceae bacterium]